MLIINPTADKSLRQCIECWQVWLVGAPSAGRVPRTCPNDCNASVLDAKTLAEVAT
ncbi:MAG TPA: hypothetical protein VGQ08_04685 [Nitrospiraceae bacterium]|jgi:hypothetical protein|nr:hypothetical protein [Nitrospiraceae bacterium]